MTGRDASAYALLGCIWGSSFALTLRTVAAFGWVGAVSLRCLLGAAALVVLAALTRRPLRLRGSWRHVAVVGATTVAGQLLGMAWGMPRIGSAMSAIIVASVPLFALLISHAWGLEPITRAALLGLGCGAVGIVLLVGFPEAPMNSAFLLGSLASLAAAYAGAYGSCYARRYLRDVGSWEISAASFFIGGLIAAPLLLLEPVPRMPDLADIVALLALAVVVTAAAYVVFFALVARIGATRAISVEFVVTAIAVAIGTVLLGERLTIIQVAGGAAILSGCLLVLGVDPVSRWRAGAPLR